MTRRGLHLLVFLLFLLLVACGGAEVAEETRIVEVTRVVTETVVVEGEPVEVTRIVSEGEATAIAEATGAPPVTVTPATSPTPPPRLTPAPPTPTLVALEHVAEVEWPPRMRLGESDVVRLALVPQEEGYVVQAEFPEHATVTETVPLQQRPGYSVVAAARLDGVGFDVAPDEEQRQDWQQGQALHWRWTISPLRPGQQRLSVNLTLTWRPESGRSLASRQVNAFSRGLDVRVLGPFGLTRGQALALGVVGLLLGIALTAPTLGGRLPRLRSRGDPDPGSAPPRLQVAGGEGGPDLEPQPGIDLDDGERALLRALFRPYGRLVLEVEYPSGYSGARTFLALPIRPDGRSDAYTIAKLGNREAIGREVANYDHFVATTLPPMTARIQGTPVTLGESYPRAALRYTFVGAPGQPPLSLRRRLLAGADGALLEQLFATFAPTWWMQRHPYTFRLAQEYDRKLPAHYVLEPAPDASPQAILDGNIAPASTTLTTGDVVTLRHVRVAGQKQGGEQLALVGEPTAGQPPLRLRWLSPQPPAEEAVARVVATRAGLLQQWTVGFDRYDLPDPLRALPALLATTVAGSRSTIHGDLNLENTLIGPGDVVWLIDFAETREGHTLYDFAHLGAEIVAHVLSRQVPDAASYVTLLQEGGGPLLGTVAGLARRCLHDPERPDEYRLAFALACLGALKFENLDAQARHYLYLTAAYLVSQNGDTPTVAPTSPR